MAKGPPRPPAHSGGKRGSSDLVRLYLQDIGRVDLLSHEEELTWLAWSSAENNCCRSAGPSPSNPRSFRPWWTWSTAASSWLPI